MEQDRWRLNNGDFRRHRTLPSKARLTLEGWLARVDVAFEIVKALPCGLRWLAAGARRVGRGLDELHVRDIARAVRKNRARCDAYDELRADRLGEERIVLAHPRLAIHAQALRFAMHCDKQDSDARIDEDVAKRFEHPVAVIVGKGEL